jgi:hypothetical protein
MEFDISGIRSSSKTGDFSFSWLSLQLVSCSISPGVKRHYRQAEHPTDRTLRLSLRGAISLLRKQALRTCETKAVSLLSIKFTIFVGLQNMSFENLLVANRMSAVSSQQTQCTVAQCGPVVQLLNVWYVYLPLCYTLLKVLTQNLPTPANRLLLFFRYSGPYLLRSDHYHPST